MPEREAPERRPGVTATPMPSSAPERRPDITAIPNFFLVDLPPGNGTWYQPIYLPAGVVNPYTPVFASICETAPGPEGVPTPNAGAATVRINNIVPEEDVVLLQIEVDWNWPLPLQVALAIGPESGIV
jgi:hypothetical protein